MKAVGLLRYLPIDDPEALIDLELERPVATGRDLLVRVEAVSVNPVDTKVRAPKDKVETAPKVLGWDASGVVEAVGKGVTLFRPGDTVFYAGDITRAGSNAEYQLVDERIVGRKPASLSHAQAAALPLTAITAWEALFDRLGIDPLGGQAGQSLLIVGAGGGVGSIAIQIASAAGLTVIATASRPESAAWVCGFGADHVVDHSRPLRPQIEALGLHYVDHVALFHATDQHWDATVDIVRPQGTVVCIVENGAPLAQSLAKDKSVKLAWEFMFTRAKYGTRDMIAQHELLCHVAQEIDAGRLRTTLSETLSPICARTLREAHRRIESGRTTGKIALEGWT